jgi:hypothetical protein
MLPRVIWGLVLSLAATACGGRTSQLHGDGLDPGLVVGGACSGDADCGSGYSCMKTESADLPVPDGYCVPKTSCSGVPCPAGTVCALIPYATIPGICMVACSGDSECRHGYHCYVVQQFPGIPTSPASPGKVCWTNNW